MISFGHSPATMPVLWRFFMLVTLSLVFPTTCAQGDNSTSVVTPPPPKLSLQDILLEVRRLKAELQTEKKLRLELQSQTAINAEVLRRLQRSILLSARDTRDQLGRIWSEQTRLEQKILRQGEVSQTVQNVTSLVQEMEERLDKQENKDDRDVKEDLVEMSLYSVTENITKTLDSLSKRIAVAESNHTSLLDLIEENKDIFKGQLKRKLRNFRRDFIESTSRDYTDAMRTFESDLKAFRLHVDQTISDIRTNMNRDSRTVADAFHVLEVNTNSSLDKLAEDNYFIAKAQLAQVDEQRAILERLTNLEEEVRGQKTLVESLDVRFGNVTETISSMRQKVVNRGHGLVELEFKVLCPHPFIKSGGSCYHLLQETLPWPSAHSKCKEMARAIGGEGGLATGHPDTHPLRSFVREHIGTPLEGDPYVWVGATNSNPDSEWRWVDGSVIKQDLFPWGRSEPDPNVDQPYLCVKLSGDALFHNCQSSSELFAVCELLADPLLGKNLSFNNFQGNDLVTRRGDPAFKSDFLFGDSELISDTVGNGTNSLR